MPFLLLLLGALAVPQFPTQFVATVETTAHLVDKSKTYPPWLRRVRLAYDFVNKRARASILAGYDAGKNYTRRYDEKHEYVVRGGEFPDCQRCYMGEPMPPPQLPRDARRETDALIDGRPVEHWVVDNHPAVERSHLYFDAASRLPRRLVNEMLESGEHLIPIMTYDILDLELVVPADLAFALDPPWHHDNCTRRAGGWPYLHLFHHYLMI
ncbi:hypothetical protein CTAYLR_003640 [Chrysophaeum taylorii]|uniref:Uncharacterized protein n=1 Tax=Chrysophaeum taylorii TaxID=2483200 RepID=A0AAD7UD29_9STRA|nr:hypothetical protein CTAYLR_003640 [Chrysophaeum taylorii]